MHTPVGGDSQSGWSIIISLTLMLVRLVWWAWSRQSTRRYLAFCPGGPLTMLAGRTLCGGTVSVIVRYMYLFVSKSRKPIIPTVQEVHTFNYSTTTSVLVITFLTWLLEGVLNVRVNYWQGIILSLKLYKETENIINRPYMYKATNQQITRQ